MLDLFGTRARDTYSDILERRLREQAEQNRHMERMAEIAAKRNTWTTTTVTRTLVPSKKPYGPAMRAEDV